jgi:putative ABC transport system ATP-binding protein
VSTADVLGLFRELHEQGRTVVIITHEPDVAAQAARTIHILDGQVVDDHAVTAGVAS